MYGGLLRFSAQLQSRAPTSAWSRISRPISAEKRISMCTQRSAYFRVFWSGAHGDCLRLAVSLQKREANSQQHFVNSTFNIFNSNVPIRVCSEFTNFQLIFSFRAGGAIFFLIFSQHPLQFLHEFRISGAQYSKKYLRFAPEARKKIMIFTYSHPTFSSEFTQEA